jgi:hypothetical protein
MPFQKYCGAGAGVVGGGGGHYRDCTTSHNIYNIRKLSCSSVAGVKLAQQRRLVASVITSLLLITFN